jgi:hypothetical protein
VIQDLVPWNASGSGLFNAGVQNFFANVVVHIKFLRLIYSDSTSAVISVLISASVIDRLWNSFIQHIPVTGNVWGIIITDENLFTDSCNPCVDDARWNLLWWLRNYTTPRVETNFSFRLSLFRHESWSVELWVDIESVIQLICLLRNLRLNVIPHLSHIRPWAFLLFLIFLVLMVLLSGKFTFVELSTDVHTLCLIPSQLLWHLFEFFRLNSSDWFWSFDESQWVIVVWHPCVHVVWRLALRLEILIISILCSSIPFSFRFLW